jgi:hypothetical protein
LSFGTQRSNRLLNVHRAGSLASATATQRNCFHDHRHSLDLPAGCALAASAVHSSAAGTTSFIYNTHNVQSRGCIRSRGCSSPADVVDVDGSPAPSQRGGSRQGTLGPGFLRVLEMPDLRNSSSSVGIDRSELRQSASPIINSHNEDAAADVWPLGGTSRRILAGLARTRRSPCQ